MEEKELKKEIKFLEGKIAKNKDSLLFARLADRYLELGDVEKAFDICDNGIKKSPKYITAYIIMAKICLAMGLTDDAEEALKNARELDTDIPFALTMLGDIYENKDEPDLLSQIIEEAVILSPYRDWDVMPEFEAAGPVEEEDVSIIDEDIFEEEETPEVETKGEEFEDISEEDLAEVEEELDETLEEVSADIVEEESELEEEFTQELQEEEPEVEEMEFDDIPLEEEEITTEDMEEEPLEEDTGDLLGRGEEEDLDLEMDTGEEEIETEEFEDVMDVESGAEDIETGEIETEDTLELEPEAEALETEITGDALEIETGEGDGITEDTLEIGIGEGDEIEEESLEMDIEAYIPSMAPIKEVLTLLNG